MTTRGDQRKNIATRTDVQGLGDGLGGSNVYQPDMVIRDTVAATGHLQTKVTEENVVQVVRELVEAIQGPLARDVMEIGRFINEDGECLRLSASTIRKLKDYFDDIYSPI